MMLDLRFLKTPIAHRGLWNVFRPENSLDAISAAIDVGFGIEIDLQISADGEAMVFHDDRLERLTTHQGWVADYETTDLSLMKLAGEDATIPTLSEVLDFVAGRVPILIELKDQTAHPGGTLGPLETRVMRLLGTYKGPVAVMSFHPGIVKNLSRMLPGVPRGLIGKDFKTEALDPEIIASLNDYAAFSELECSFISHAWRDLSMPAVARLKAHFVPVLCWTVRAKAEETFARRIADNVTFEGYLPS